MLVLGVVLTVGLSIASRSVTEVSVSTTQEEAARALEAAEAGVEKALGGEFGVGSFQGGVVADSSFAVSVSADSPVGQIYEVPYELVSGEAATVDLRGSGGGGGVTVCWGKNDTPETPAVEVILYYQVGTEVRVGRRGWDPESAVRGNSLNEGAVGVCPIEGKYKYSRSFTISELAGGSGPSDIYFLRVRMLYAASGQRLMVSRTGAGDLAAQGREIVSVGTVGMTEQKAVQRLRVADVNDDLPFMFDSVLFSGGSLVNQ